VLANAGGQDRLETFPGHVEGIGAERVAHRNPAVVLCMGQALEHRLEKPAGTPPADDIHFLEKLKLGVVLGINHIEIDMGRIKPFHRRRRQLRAFQQAFSPQEVRQPPRQAISSARRRHQAGNVPQRPFTARQTSFQRCHMQLGELSKQSAHSLVLQLATPPS